MLLPRTHDVARWCETGTSSVPKALVALCSELRGSAFASSNRETTAWRVERHHAFMGLPFRASIATLRIPSHSFTAGRSFVVSLAPRSLSIDSRCRPPATCPFSLPLPPLCHSNRSTVIPRYLYIHPPSPGTSRGRAHFLLSRPRVAAAAAAESARRGRLPCRGAATIVHTAPGAEESRVFSLYPL
jgi:hypothetical protein